MSEAGLVVLPDICRPGAWVVDEGEGLYKTLRARVPASQVGGS